MAINTNLLVAAPMLQDYFVDKTLGTPLANGVVTLYQDTARQIYKNWYYQTGVPGSYTFVPLDNPLHLSSVGTIQDPFGNDVIPFFYPYDETSTDNIPQPYYITVDSVDSNGAIATRQFTRENFPFLGQNASPVVTGPTLDNLIVNGEYWRNISSVNVSNATAQLLAPSQHEGYTNPDINWIKDITGATDAIAFLPMTEELDDDITPEFYLNAECTAVQPGETVKCVQYPISLHVATLQNVAASVVIHAQNVSGNTNNYLDLYIYQFLGTGALSQPAPILIQRILLNNTFQKFVIPFIFPNAAGLSLGGGGDDALFLRVQYPLASLFQINHTKPQIYLSNTVPDNSFQTYDSIASVINSPRTGSVKITMNSFNDDSNGFGWVVMNDGSIGSSSSAATTRNNADTWPLYNVLWNSVADTYAPVSGGRGANAYADFSANKTLGLTKQLGRLLAGMGAPSSGDNVGTSWALGQTTGNEQALLTLNNMPDHTHNAPSGAQYLVQQSSGIIYNSTANAGTLSTITGPVTGHSTQTQVNLQNPVVYYRILMKL